MRIDSLERFWLHTLDDVLKIFKSWEKILEHRPCLEVCLNLLCNSERFPIGKSFGKDVTKQGSLDKVNDIFLHFKVACAFSIFLSLDNLVHLAMQIVSFALFSAGF